MYIDYNANPEKKIVRDCVIRALSKVLNQDWEKTYMGVCTEGFRMHDLPEADCVWGAYLREKGYTRKAISNSCPIYYTVSDFCKDNPQGTYILALSGHVVAVIDGDYYDTWDCGNEIPVYVWKQVTT